MRDKRHIILGENIRKVRVEQGLSQRVLARMIGTSQSTLFNIEHGNSDAKASTLFRIADALDVKVEDLFAAEDRINV